MKGKTILKLGLNIFIMVSCVVLVVRSFQKPPTAEGPNLPKNGLVVAYMHGAVRCPTCKSIESQTHKTIADRFGPQLKDATASWIILDYEKPQNAALAKEYEVAMPSVLLLKREEGKTVEGKNLARVWELVGEPEKFADYIGSEVDKMLNQSSPRE
jgi:hypothetical protein